MMNPFASKAYKEGWKAGLAGSDLNFGNPYADEAEEDNYRRGMGGSVHWDTRYKPYIDWYKGCSDARAPMIEKQLMEIANRSKDNPAAND